MSKNADFVKLLWTGGWDSTFRLLQLLLIENKVVKPYYFIDPNRKSLTFEIRAMREIKDRLYKKYPEVRNRLLPTYICEIFDIKENPATTEHFQVIKEKYAFGVQYDWLARFAAEHDFFDLELSWEKYVIETPRRRALMPQVNPSKYSNICLDPSVYEVFKYFRFPIFEVTKHEMITIAEQEGFYDLMELTWSCHLPSRRGIACGRCTPCLDIMKTGFGHRLHPITRIKYYFFKPLIDIKEKSPRTFNILRRLKKIFPGL